MLEIERQIINILDGIKENNFTSSGQKSFYVGTLMDELSDQKKIQKLLKKLKTYDIATLSLEFLNHPSLDEYLMDPNREEFCEMSDGYLDSTIGKYLIFWKMIRNASVSPEPIPLELLSPIENVLEAENATYTAAYEIGRAIHNEDIFSPFIFKMIYGSNKQQLIMLFQKYFKNIMPHEKFFSGQPIPAIIAAKNDLTITFLSSAAQSGRSFSAIENAALVLQRAWRHKLRERSYQRLLNSLPNAKTFDPHSTNKIYHPKCNKKLADRIIDLTKKVKLFDTVKHLTSQKNLTSVINDGLFGRKNLLEHLMSFSQAALKQSDIARGDANVICLGPNKMDPLCIQDDTVEIVFNSDLLLNSKLPIFLKLRDFGFNIDWNPTTTIPLFSEFSDDEFKEFSFIHTAFSSKGIEFRLIHKEHCVANCSFPFYEFIFNNSPNIHQLLALCFFKFIDELKPTHSSAQNITEKIYAKISLFNDKELLAFIERVGKALLTTAEFNIYGAYRIDFSTVKSITSGYKLTIKSQSSQIPYQFNLESFIFRLNDGDSKAIHEAIEHLPELFKSYRFLDYLLTKTSHKQNYAALQDLREKCEVPRWLKSFGLFSQTVNSKPSDPKELEDIEDSSTLHQ